jgi:hypothetical protein
VSIVPATPASPGGLATCNHISAPGGTIGQPRNTEPSHTDISCAVVNKEQSAAAHARATTAAVAAGVRTTDEAGVEVGGDLVGLKVDVVIDPLVEQVVRPCNEAAWKSVWKRVVPIVPVRPPKAGLPGCQVITEGTTVVGFLRRIDTPARDKGPARGTHDVVQLLLAVAARIVRPHNLQILSFA